MRLNRKEQIWFAKLVYVHVVWFYQVTVSDVKIYTRLFF